MLLLLLVAGCHGTSQPPAPAGFGFDGGGATSAVDRLAHGKRLARVLGCLSCHGDDLQGRNATAADPEFGDMNAPNVTLMLAAYSDAALDRLIRHGEPRDRQPFWFMSSEGFQFLADRDLADLILYLRGFRPAGRPMPPLRFGPGFRRAQQTGEVTTAQQLVARFAREAPVDLGVQHARGRWLARTICAECHNASLQGYVDYTPNLDIAGAYSAAQLEQLLVTGVGLGGRDLGDMSATARARLRALTPGERRALIGYLLARARADTR